MSRSTTWAWKVEASTVGLKALRLNSGHIMLSHMIELVVVDIYRGNFVQKKKNPARQKTKNEM
jgi:hypothetical protein